jgi:hypothetical protein
VTKGTKKPGVMLDAPMAITSAGDVVMNITHLEQIGDVTTVVARLLGEGHEVFVGVAAPGALRRELLKDIDDAGADLVGRLGARLCRAKR